MNFSTSMIKVSGVWRHLLIVSSDTELEFFSDEITNSFTDESGDVIATVYYTEGVFSHKYQGGMHYYWFLYNSSRMTVNGQPDDDTLAALELLGVDTGV